MKASMTNPNQCLYCGKQLSVFHLLLDSLYCSRLHKTTHFRELNELALARLTEGRSAAQIRWDRRPTELSCAPHEPVLAD
jgi:hypothetical protein